MEYGTINDELFVVFFGIYLVGSAILLHLLFNLMERRGRLRKSRRRRYPLYGLASVGAVIAIFALFSL